MRINEFINNDSILTELLNGLIFFDNKWIFPNHLEFISELLKNRNIEISPNRFTEIGLKLAENLNKMGVDVLEYDENKIPIYLSKF